MLHVPAKSARQQTGLGVWNQPNGNFLFEQRVVKLFLLTLLGGNDDLLASLLAEMDGAPGSVDEMLGAVRVRNSDRTGCTRTAEEGDELIVPSGKVFIMSDRIS